MTLEPASGKALQTQSTRLRIIRAARDLFNAKGTGAVTTHHIADAAGISPGNLYYHFKNKEEIVREIFHEMEIYSETQWLEKGPGNPKVSFVEFNRFFFGNVEKYRFFHRDYPRLLRDDSVLARQWRQTYEALFAMMRKAVRRWCDEGILRRFTDEREADAFIENCWVILNFASVHLEARGADKRRGPTTIELVLRFLYPYHTPSGQKALDLYLQEL